MSAVNDANTRIVVRAAADQFDSLLSHFHDNPDATWESFGKVPSYIAKLHMNLQALELCVAKALRETQHVEGTDFGT